MGEWIKNIIYYIIFFSVVLYLLPDEKYKKYMQSAIGFIMIIVVISPMISWVGLKKDLAYKLRLDIPDYKWDYQEDEYYKDIVKMSVQQELYDDYGFEGDVHIVLNKNRNIEKIELYNYILPEYKTYALKKKLSNEYGIAQEDIVVY